MNPGLWALAPFWTALLVAAVIARPIYKALLAMKSRQTVSQYAPEGHQVKQGTPTMGGIIIVLGILAGVLAASLAPSSVNTGVVEPGWNITVIAGLRGSALSATLILLLGFAFIGFVDDFLVPRLIKGKRGLGWKQKILMQIVLAVLAVGMSAGWKVTAETAVTVFVILFTANAYNFLDGLDALAGSVLIALCLGLLALASVGPTAGLATVVPLTMIAATIPFLFINAPPAKVFMGDVGSLPIGALLGLVFSRLAFGGEWTFYTPYSSMPAAGVTSFLILPLLVLGLVLFVELVPVPMQILWVKLFKRRLFLYTPIHHAFEKKGWAETRVVWAFLLTQIVLSALAYTIAIWPLVGAAQDGSRSHYYYIAPESGKP